MPAHQGKFVAYYNADRQGKCGLGPEAQRKAVLHYLDGGRWELVAEFTEIESDKPGDRPELAKALAVCRRQRAKLVIAKLDRLFRNRSDRPRRRLDAGAGKRDPLVRRIAHRASVDQGC
jgi:DNA invertase Pin-like site-specific DNA recombinase